MVVKRTASSNCNELMKPVGESVGDSEGESVVESVVESVGDSVGESVVGFVGEAFSLLVASFD